MWETEEGICFYSYWIWLIDPLGILFYVTVSFCLWKIKNTRVIIKEVRGRGEGEMRCSSVIALHCLSNLKTFIVQRRVTSDWRKIRLTQTMQYEAINILPCPVVDISLKTRRCLMEEFLIRELTKKFKLEPLNAFIVWNYNFDFFSCDGIERRVNLLSFWTL